MSISSEQLQRLIDAVTALGTPVVGDIEIGAVEVKDATTDARAPVDATFGLGVDVKRSTGDTLTGALIETAPATDTASSGLNGRLQRIAQRLTSLLALLPSALTVAGNLKTADQEPIPDTTATGALGALSAAVTMSTKGLSTVASEIDLGTLVGTVTYEVTQDDVTWTAIQYASGNSTDANTSFPVRRRFNVAGYSQFRIKVSAFTSGTSNARLRGSVGSSGIVSAQVFSDSGGYDADARAVNAVRISVNADMRALNGSTADRWRNNFAAVALASAARTITQTLVDITTYNAKSLKVILDMTNVAAGPSVTLTIQGKSASGIYYTLLAGLPVVTAVTNVYEVGPGLPATANLSANAVLPRTIRFIVTANNANSGTYSLDYELSV